MFVNRVINGVIIFKCECRWSAYLDVLHKYLHHEENPNILLSLFIKIGSVLISGV